MKKYKLLGTILFSGILLIGACGNKDKKVVDGDKDEPLVTTEVENSGGSVEYGDGYGFSEFDLEIEVNGEDAIDIEYKVKKKAEAEYDNNLQDFHLKDEEAMDAIDEMFVAIFTAKETPEKELKRNILQFLNINEYSKFDLNITFDDDTKLHINDGE